MYCALDIAKYVLGYYCIKKDGVCSNLKLQKILYFLQANHLVQTEYPLFQDEIEAIDFGPIVWSVYNEYKIYGGASIPFSLFKDNDDWNVYIYNRDRKIMDPLLDKLENYSSTALLAIIHNQKPWNDAYYGPSIYQFDENTRKLKSKKIITNKSLYDYFKN